MASKGYPWQLLVLGPINNNKNPREDRDDTLGGNDEQDSRHNLSLLLDRYHKQLQSTVMEPVKFTIDKEYRPHISELQQELEKQRELTEVERTKRTTNMTPKLLELAQEHILVSLKDMQIIDWHSWFSNQSDIYVVTTVTDGTSNNPLKLELKDFPHVKRGDKLSIGEFGVMMYERSGTVPDYLDIRILVARNKQPTRDAGKALQDISNNNDFKNAVSVLSSILSGPAGIVTGQIDNIVGIIGSILSIQNDDKILYYPVTVSKEFDDLGLGIHCDGTQFVKFCYQIQLGA